MEHNTQIYVTMKKAIEITVILITTATLLYLHSEYVIRHVQRSTDAIHQRHHKMLVDSVRMHNYFEATYNGDNDYQPTSVVVECDLIK